ncbi:MAG: sensor histidine kinase, partial [Deltaproteobacteria bacterium]
SITEQQLSDAILQGATRISDTVKKSIGFDMLENRKENAYRIMDTIGRQPGIEKVRIYSSDGKIIFSTDKGELGRMVDKQGEACYGCHSRTKPLEALTTAARSRIFESGHGHRVLGIINPMYNEEGCSSTECHIHPETQKVLGTIDVTMSLADADRGIAQARDQVIFFNALSIVTISAIVVLLMMRFVAEPVKELVIGTRKVAAGDLGSAIAVTSEDEMGHLARSFNDMTEKLSRADQEVREHFEILERKFNEKARELKEAQAHLLHTEKLAAVGKIAATVAHEINNPLTGVFTYIKLMERRLEEGRNSDQDIRKFREYLATMGREVERTSAIVLNLLDFTRPKEPSRKVANINALIEESLVLIRNKLTMNNVEIRHELGPLPDIMVDPSQIKQVFINIIVNSCEAMERGGSLFVRSRYDEDDQAAVIEFHDTGPGIPPEILSKIFDPFFTTKEKGTGLGLSVAYGIVTRHNGIIEVNSRPGEGTQTRVVLPSVY